MILLCHRPLEAGFGSVKATVRHMRAILESSPALITATVRVRFWCASKMVFNFAIRLLRLSRRKNAKPFIGENYEDSFPITIFVDSCFRNAAVSLRPRSKSEAAG